MRNGLSKKFVVIMIAIILAVCFMEVRPFSVKAANGGAGKVIDASKDYLEPGKSKRFMIMELGATACIPCKAMVPILDELARELAGKADIQFVDVNKRGDLADKYQIFSIPTQIFFDRNGKELYRHMGFYPKADINKKLKELGLI